MLAIEDNQLIRLVLETLPVGVLVVNREGDIVLGNEASQSIWGGTIRNGSERYERSLGYVHGSGEKVGARDWASARALADGVTTLNELIDIVTFDGRSKIIRNSAAPICDDDGSIVGAVVVNEDVTDRVQTEQALRRSEDDLRLVIDTMPMLAWTMLPDGAVDFVNRRWREYFGISLEELAADPTGLIHTDDRERVNARWRIQMSNGEANFDEMRLRRADGEYCWFLVRVAPLHDERGKIRKWYGVNVNIDDRKRAEEALWEANHRLRVLSRRNVQLQEEERRRLARELHDQIGQLLTVAKINVQSAQVLDADPTMRAKLIETAAILDSVLQEVRKISLSLRPSALDDLGLAPALRWMLSKVAGTANIAAEFSADADLLRADAESETACYRVAVEAVTNVVRHAQAQKIVMTLHNAGDGIELHVRDDGRGFNVVAVDAAPERDRLGLIGMRERAFAVGGQFTMKSRPGAGTEIIAYFPISPAPDMAS